VARKLLPLLLLALMLPGTIRAQSDDAAYCAELSNLYRRYLGTVGERSFPDATAATAMDQCQKGNYAQGIPPLEKKLRDARFTLPKRS
jgi:hypothetical protein